MAATITIETTVIQRPQDCCAACFNFVLNVNNQTGGPAKKVVEVSHDADCDLTVTETSRSGAKATFTLRPGQVHRLEFDENTSMEHITKVINTWSYEFADGRKFKVEKTHKRIKEGEETVSKA